MRRTAPVTLVLVATALATTACTPKVVGTSGVTRAADGGTVFLAEVCSDEVERATVSDVAMFSRGSRLAANAETDADEDRADELMADSRVVGWSGDGTDGSLTVPLTGEVDGARWSVDDGGRELRPGVRYSFGASDDDQDVTLARVEFTLADVAALRPGEVRTAGGETVADVQTFRAAACG